MSGFEALKLLIKFKDEGTAENIIELLSKNLAAACQVLNIEVTKISDLETVRKLSGEFHPLLERESTVWNFICFGYYILIDHIQPPKDDLETLLSVNQQKDIRTLLEILLMFGLVPNLIPGVGVSLNARSQFANKIPREDISVIEKYIRLRFSTMALLECNKNPELRKFIVARHLGDLLAALFQLSFAPLKKPNSTSASTSSQFEISEELWNKLQDDRVFFKGALDSVLDQTYQPLLIKEIMILMGMDKPLAPKWLKSEASRILCSILVKKDGILSLVRAIFDTDSVDTGAEWKHMEVLQKLIFDIGSVSMFPNFYTVICGQIIKMLEEVDEENTKNLYLILPRLFIKSIIDRRKDIFEREIFDNIISPIARCTKTNHLSVGILVSEPELNQSLKFIYQIFALEINTKTEISTQLYLLPYVDIFYQIYAAVYSSGTSLHIVKYTKAILKKILNDSNFDQLSCAVQIILFRRTFENFHIFNDNFQICLGPAGGIFIKKSDYGKINYVISEKDESFLNLIENLTIAHQAEIFKIVFNEFCNIFLTKNTENPTSTDLLSLEPEQENAFQKLTREKLVLLKILAKSAEHKSVMEQLDLGILIKFILKFLKRHENANTDMFESAEGLFLALMLLDILIDNFHDIDQLKCLINPLEAIAQNTNNDELKVYISRTVEKIRHDGMSKSGATSKSQLDEALEELCDPLLPVRAHALMTLTKLIENKDKDACARQQYLLCIFQENLKNTDSYIYLTAINGIATLANVYTDSVIEILTEEYVSTTHQWRDQEEHQRVRMNLGEVLVRVTKMLGEMAPKYKALLLNAFLFGVKDDDNLIRASSLSNLGQACEVLGYKLGNATTEILQCLEAVIETDKAIEAKRAAVMVLYQLLKGLGPDTIVFLKEALLPIYRKLKDIYQNSNDDVMKLHAQLALEELNSATRNFLLPPVQMEKNINIFDV